MQRHFLIELIRDGEPYELWHARTAGSAAEAEDDFARVHDIPDDTEMRAEIRARPMELAPPGTIPQGLSRPGSKVYFEQWPDPEETRLLVTEEMPCGHVVHTGVTIEPLFPGDLLVFCD